MKHISTFIWLFLLTAFSVNELQAQQLLAFPGAEGYGKYVSGGRGGRVIEVTTLKDLDESGAVVPGSFRAALTTAGTDPVTIVFKVSGVINLSSSELRSSRPNMTIAGQTAPGDGICIRGGTVNLSGSYNVIIRYIRFRPGDEKDAEISALRLENSHDFIVDHCSMSWAIEETTHFSAGKNFTIQWCIISESLYNSIHKKGARGYAAQWGGSYATYHHNFLAHHQSRMPRINGSNENDIEALVDYRNNVNYNWGSSGAFYGGEWEATPNCTGFSHINVVNNYFKPGPGTSGSTFVSPSLNRDGRTLCGYAQWYIAGNTMIGNDAKTADNWLGVDVGQVGSAANIKAPYEWESNGVVTETASNAFNSVMNNVGAIRPKRDKIDTRVIGEAKGTTPIVRYTFTRNDVVTPVRGVNSGIIDTQDNLRPYDAPSTWNAWDANYTSVDDPSFAPADSDHDGMPDAWELQNGLNPADSTDRNIVSGTGYTHLEDYFNQLSDGTYEPKMINYVVARDGSGDYTTIQAAIDAVASNSTGRTIIFVKKGIYNEKVYIPAAKTNISLIGENPDSVKVVYNDYSGKGSITTATSYTLWAEGNDLYMENMTITNSSGNVGQAVALRTTGERQVFKNCRLLGYQDTYYAHKGRQYLYQCYIEGAVDFVFGDATAVLDQCEISCIPGGGYVSAPADTKLITTLPDSRTFYHGLQFRDCTVTAASGVTNGSYSLGRPWQPNASSVFVNCKLGNHIKAEGWTPWNGSEASGYFGEYKSKDLLGNLKDVSGRISWSHQVADADTIYYGLDYFLKKDGVSWNPRTITVVPAKPTNFAVDERELSWTPVASAIGYVIYRDGSALSYTTASSYTDEFAQAFTDYTYYVVAMSISGALSESTNVISSNSGSGVFVKAPTNLTAAVDNKIYGVVSWKDNSDNEEHFIVERAAAEGEFSVVATLPANATGFRDSTLADFSAYRYRVKATTSTSSSTYTSVVSISTLSLTTLPKKVTLIFPVNGANYINTTESLRWNTDANTDTYDVYFGEANPPAFVVNQTSGTFTPAGGMQKDKTYYWRIDAKNSAGTTVGDVWSFTSVPGDSKRLMANWPLNDLTGGTTSDIVNSNTATLVGTTPSLVEGKKSSAFQFDGTQYLTVANHGSIDPTDSSFTMSFWMKLPTLPSSTATRYNLIAKGALDLIGTTQKKWYGFQLAGNFLYFSVNDGTTRTTLTRNISTLFTANHWMMVTAVRNRVSKKVGLYLNGVLLTAEGNDITTTSISNTNALVIGQGMTNSVNYVGGMDDIRLYNYAMTAAQVTELLNSYTMGINDLTVSQMKVVYANGILRVPEDVEVRVISVAGVVVGNYSNTTGIDLTHLAKGAYIVKAKDALGAQAIIKIVR